MKESMGSSEARGDGDSRDAATGGASSPRSITPAQRVEALREANRRGGILSFLADWAKILVIAIVLFLLMRTFVVEAFKIPSGSMENTLQVGDFLLVNKFIYGADVPFTHWRLPRVRAPQRGDVMVFEWPVDESKYLVKRVVGVPGDTLEMREGTLIRDGAAVDEQQYVVHTDPDMDPAPEDFEWQRGYLVRTAAAASGYHPSRNNWGPLVVPGGNYFVLGDNRDNSLDSRYWGFVPDSLVKGRPFVIYYSFAPDSADNLDWLTHVRWSRVGERIR